jgi:hypothetical protein
MRKLLHNIAEILNSIVILIGAYVMLIIMIVGCLIAVFLLWAAYHFFIG